MRARTAHLSFEELKGLPLGSALRLVYPAVAGRANGNDRKIHLRGWVDGMAVFRTWQRGKRRWFYEVESENWWSVVARPAHVSTERPSGTRR